MQKRKKERKLKNTVYLVTIDGAIRAYSASTSVLGVFNSKSKAEDAVFQAYKDVKASGLSLSDWKKRAKISELGMNRALPVTADTDEISTSLYLGGYSE